MNAISADAGQLKAQSRSIHWVYISPGTLNSQPILPTVPYRGGRLQGLDAALGLGFGGCFSPPEQPQTHGVVHVEGDLPKTGDSSWKVWHVPEP